MYISDNTFFKIQFNSIPHIHLIVNKQYKYTAGTVTKVYIYLFFTPCVHSFVEWCYLFLLIGGLVLEPCPMLPKAAPALDFCLVLEPCPTLPNAAPAPDLCLYFKATQHC